MNSRTVFQVFAAAGLAAFVACAGPEITSLTERTDLARRSQDAVAVDLLQCPTSESSTHTALVTPFGGTIAVGGTSVVIPAGALLTNALVTVTIPASRYVEVEISVQGFEHFVFELPVVATISYARCSRSNIDHAPLSVWYIDSETKEPLEAMGGIDNKLLRTVTFTTGHLSGYAIAN